MIERYFGLDLNRLGYFFGLCIGVGVLTTGLFWLLFGFDKWEQNVQMGADLMAAAAVAAPQPQMQPQVVRTAPAANAAGQFVCPQDGAVGLPNIDAAGVPHCPACGQTMVFNSPQSGNLALAAAAAG